MSFVSPSGRPYRAEHADPYAITRWFYAIDLGAKGYVTEGDFEAEAETFFAELDLDRDGLIGSREITQYEMDVAPETQTSTGTNWRTSPRVRACLP